MIDNSRYKCLIYDEFSDDELTEYFEYTSQKVLHNIDTLYYSIKLVENFVKDSKDRNVILFRRYFRSLVENLEFGSMEEIKLPGVPPGLLVSSSHYSKYYSIHICYAEKYDWFIALNVPPGSDGGSSLTSEIIVQIRSHVLWQDGVHAAIDESYSIICSILSFFHLTPYEVKENRCDFAFHTNYLQNPERFFNIENFVKMAVHNFRGIQYHYTFKPDNDYENDYVALGTRGKGTFIRIYHKSKEVVEQGYKGFFLELWYKEKLISLYDRDCLAYAFSLGQGNWKSLDIGRLNFYAEHGKNKNYAAECKHIVDGDIKKSPKYIKDLADFLCPPVHTVVNVEYQVMRKGTKRYELFPFRPKEYDPVKERLEEFLDNWNVITEYLTHNTLRFVDKDKTTRYDTVYVPFWQRIRAAAESEYAPPKPDDRRLVIDYGKRLSRELVKTRTLRSAVNLSIYRKGINNDIIQQDIADSLLRLNDNDLHRMESYKAMRQKILDNERYDFSTCMEENSDRDYIIMDKNTGEVIYSSDREEVCDYDSSGL